MSKAKTATNFLLVDRSGSMHSRAYDTAKSINAFVKNLKEEVPNSKLVVAYFDDSYVVMYNGIVRDCPHLGYVARASTSLIKALSELMEDSADYKSLTVISGGSDTGNEMWCRDASKAAAQQAVAGAKKAKVNVGLLATGSDAMNLGAVLDIDPDLQAEFKPVDEGVMRGAAVYSKAVARGSKGGSASLTTLERASIEESPEEIAAKNGEELVTQAKVKKLLKQMYKDDVGQFFSVTFKKRTPPYKVRTFGQAQFHVTSKMKADGAGATYDFLEKDLVPCWVHDKLTADDLQDSKSKQKVGDVTGFRSIPLDGILAVRAGGKKYRVQTGG